MTRSVKYILTLALLSALFLTACGQGENEENTQPGGSTMIANPFTECSTMSAAQKGAGFEMTAPETLGGAEPVIRVMKGYMIELVYDTEGGERIRIRKAVGDEDISGDYTDYADVTVFSVGGVEVTLKGDGADSYALAAWTAEGYSYSLSTAGGSSREFLLELAGYVK